MSMRFSLIPAFDRFATLISEIPTRNDEESLIRVDANNSV